MKKFSFFIIILAAIILSFRLWLPLPAKFLLVEDNLNRAESIFILRGDAYYRFYKAVEIYKKGLASNIVVAHLRDREKELEAYYNFETRILGLPDVTPRDKILKTLEYFGKDASDVYFLDESVTSTFDEAVAAKKWYLDNGVRSFILISSTYHMRRALMIFQLVFLNTGVEIYPVTVPNETYHPETWWRYEKDVKRVFEEYLSIGFNFIYHFVLNKHQTGFDNH